jgi:acetyl/propionyl-CoA carboxylase alpha subunit
MYKIKVNNKFEFNIARDKSGFTVNDAPVTIDASFVNENQANILLNNRSYNAELVGVNDNNTVTIKVNGVEYVVAAEDRFDALLKQLGMDNLAATKVSDLKAPMPGLVLDILVKEGDEILKGDNLVVLEAMKMENILKATADARIAKVIARKGDKLEKGSVIIQFS